MPIQKEVNGVLYEIATRDEVIEHILQLVEPNLKIIDERGSGLADTIRKISTRRPHLFFSSIEQTGQALFSGLMDAQQLHETSKLIVNSEAAEDEDAQKLASYLQGRAFLLDELQRLSELTQQSEE